MSAQPAPHVARWPACSTGLLALARVLAGQEYDQYAIASALEDAFPGLPSENYYLNPAAIALMERLRRPGPRPVMVPTHAPPATALPPGEMTHAARTLAAVRGARCVYCGRESTPEADPDGNAWQRDFVPAGQRVAGAEFALSCSACKRDPGRHARLGGDDERV